MGKRNRPKFNGNNMFWETNYDNTFTYWDYFQRLAEMAMTVFEWKGLPPSVDPRYLEMLLFYNGNAIFFKDEVVGYLTLKCILNGSFDVYNIPTNRMAIANNGYQRSLTDNDSVVIFNNYFRTPTSIGVVNYAKQLYEIDRAIDVNVKAQKTPVLITCNDKQKETMKNLYAQYDGNAPVIWGYSDLDTKAISCLKTDAPYLADRLQDLKTQIWNDAMTFIGIPNMTQEKKERLVTFEAERMMGGVFASQYGRLCARQQACDKINAMFPELGGKVECVVREEYRDSFTKESEVTTNE